MHNTVTIFCKNTNLYHEIPLGASLTLMVVDGSGDMSEEEDSVDVSVDTEKPVTSESSPAQDDSWF